MPDNRIARIQRLAALVAIAALLLLLTVATFWAWNTSNAPAAIKHVASGPIAKVSTWIEPPPSDYEIANEQARRALKISVSKRTISSSGAMVRSEGGEISQSARAAPPKDSAVAPEAGNPR